MNLPNTPETWTDPEWLAFLLIMAAHADGNPEARELRFAITRLGPELVERMRELHAGLSPGERDRILRETLPRRLDSDAAREKVQQLLRQVVLADGEYSPEEQALIGRISTWLRGEN